MAALFHLVGRAVTGVALGPLPFPPGQGPAVDALVVFMNDGPVAGLADRGLRLLRPVDRMRAVTGGACQPLFPVEGMSPRDGDVVATLASELFQALGVGDFGGIGVTLNTLQGTVRPSLEEGLIDEESNRPPCPPLLGPRSIALAFPGT